MTEEPKKRRRKGDREKGPTPRPLRSPEELEEMQQKLIADSSVKSAQTKEELARLVKTLSAQVERLHLATMLGTITSDEARTLPPTSNQLLKATAQLGLTEMKDDVPGFGNDT